MARTAYSVKRAMVLEYARRCIDAERLPKALESELVELVRTSTWPIHERAVQSLCQPYRKPWFGL